jgi:hypothetical protein
MTAVPTSAATTTINTFKPKVRILEVPLKKALSVKSGDSKKTRPRRSAVAAPVVISGHGCQCAGRRGTHPRVHRAPCVPELSKPKP